MTTFTKKPEFLFLLVATLFGFALVFLTPPFQVADEDRHFARAFSIAEGNFLSVQGTAEKHFGAVLPASLYELALKFDHLRYGAEVKTSAQEILKLSESPLNSDSRRFLGFSDSSRYPPIAYVPQVIAIWVTQIFSEAPIKMLYLGRILNLLSAIAITFFAIRKTTTLKWVFVAISCMPMTLFMRSSLSVDALVNAVGLWLFSFFLCQEVSSPKDLVGFFLAAVFISMVKFVYAPLLLLLGLSSFRDKSKWRCLVFLATIAIAASIAWMFAVAGIRVSDAPIPVLPADQISFLAQHPSQFFVALFTTLQTQGWSRVCQFIGVLGWLDVVLPTWLYISWIFVFFNLCLLDGSFINAVQYKIALRDRFLSLFIFCLISFLICAAFYLTWTPLGADYIEGIQGRYFILIAPLLFFSFSGLWKIRAHFDVSIGFSLFLFFSSSVTLWGVWRHYF